jgi:hypothetical protein
MEGQIFFVTCVAFSPNGKWIVSFTNNGTINLKICDLETRRVITCPLEGPPWIGQFCSVLSRWKAGRFRFECRNHLDFECGYCICADEKS